MFPDAALRSIADNLAALCLDPVLHLKIAVAVVGPLMGGGVTAPNPAPPKPLSPPRKAAPPKKAVFAGKRAKSRVYPRKGNG